MELDLCTNDSRLIYCPYGDSYYVGTNETKSPNAAFEGRNIKGTVEIPDYFDSKPITAVGQYAFTSCFGIERVIIGANVREIHVYAFGDLPNCKMIYISASVEFLGSASFWFWNGSSNSAAEGHTQVVFAPKSQIKYIAGSFGRQAKVQFFLPDIVRPLCGGILMRYVKIKEIISPFSFTLCGIKTKSHFSAKCKRFSPISSVSLMLLVLLIS